MFALLSAVLAAGGCASNVPREISEPVPGSPSVAQAAATPEPVAGAQVRWGGIIAGVENLADVTVLELVAKELGAFGRPRETDASDGRFLARVPGFLDPKVYAPDREVTVFGTLAGRERRSIGERPYEYPVVRADKVHLWSRPPAYFYPYADPFYDPFFDGPLYGPWGPWGDPWLRGWGPGYPWGAGPYRWWRPYRRPGIPWWW